ncbi:beta-galactoside alpha-2,6-sialyltransferase 2 isoform X2 [Lepisosteus oculatus]|uniref:beta-galactoside alpha-2,6-sialyltransferase 2 isoform X2 n=1 Tax=Lepisosteus oculatus TaxID=7918 RepID=UPI0035F50765
MKSKVKQWKQLVLMGILAWIVVFLALFTYFMDFRMNVPRVTGSLSHTETRKLTSIQVNNQNVMLSQSDIATPDSNSHKKPYNGPVLTEKTGTPNLEVWSYFENEIQNKISRDDTSAQMSTGEISVAAGQQHRKTQVNKHAVENFYFYEYNSAKTEHVPTVMKRSRLRRHRHRTSKTVEDLEEYLFKSKSVIYKLWKGNVSSKMLSPRLQKAMKEYLDANKHNVSYEGKRASKLSRQEVLCELKHQIKVQSLDGTERPFSKLGWKKFVPKISLDELHPDGFRKCAVVTSAGAMLNSSLGKEIDSHEAVVRFNAAPTIGYEKDVGNKTTIRIVNSQIIANSIHRFNISTLYRDVILIAWDPAPYTANLQKWYENPDYDLFTPYVEYRKKNPYQPFYILHPKFIWKMWDVIQENTHEKIQPNPPSSGFIGILIMMSLCDEVDVYEYVPSIRQTDLCHYHEQYYDAACTLGAYHPLLYEKMLIQKVNMGTEEDLKKKGKVTLPGFRAINCKH